MTARTGRGGDSTRSEFAPGEPPREASPPDDGTDGARGRLDPLRIRARRGSARGEPPGRRRGRGAGATRPAPSLRPARLRATRVSRMTARTGRGGDSTRSEFAPGEAPREASPPDDGTDGARGRLDPLRVRARRGSARREPPGRRRGRGAGATRAARNSRPRQSCWRSSSSKFEAETNFLAVDLLKIRARGEFWGGRAPRNSSPGQRAGRSTAAKSPGSGPTASVEVLENRPGSTRALARTPKTSRSGHRAGRCGRDLMGSVDPGARSTRTRPSCAPRRSSARRRLLLIPLTAAAKTPRSSQTQPGLQCITGC
ncbi:hypothetical protein ENSA5_08180 [Enhygromyxa salina]|uniref:Uncharacterized protein n=1 Tax=Enhygromyxa salina TaxID=215803 RepID=A0A2S9YGZ7_9BACT|nr:hypothetical protein ENSA5_08180 [Enhygromyxa salina]